MNRQFLRGALRQTTARPISAVTVGAPRVRRTAAVREAVRCQERRRRRQEVLERSVCQPTLDGQRDAIAAAQAQARDAALQARAARARRAASSGSRAPLAPIGWPSATAPPLTLTFARSMPSCWSTATQLHRERFVDLEEVNVFELPADLLRHAPDGFHRRHQQVLRRQAARGLSDDARERLETELRRARSLTSRPARRRRHSPAGHCRR